LTNIVSTSLHPDFPFLDVDAIVDAAYIPEPVHFLDDHQLDIPENELSLTYFTGPSFRRGSPDKVRLIFVPESFGIHFRYSYF
jgi:hypothetical protein